MYRYSALFWKRVCCHNILYTLSEIRIISFNISKVLKLHPLKISPKNETSWITDSYRVAVLRTFISPFFFIVHKCKLVILVSYCKLYKVLDSSKVLGGIEQKLPPLFFHNEMWFKSLLPFSLNLISFISMFK